MAEQVEILRDRWGIAHVYGDSEEAAFCGCGYAMAEDRIFQMVLRRRVVQGRIAEILGSGPGDRFVQQDRKSRIFALHRRARETVAKLPVETRRCLEAFTAGVNAFLHDRQGELDPLFTRYGGTPEPWSAADCIAIWDHLGQRFSFGWENEVPTTREAEEPLVVEPLVDDVAHI
ncbi:MAG: penicillin acylase family protein, partial [Gemmatimonadetes bacterium]|nr:penicillin acylase family protein [Gemmatimonadota bacterium]